MRKHTHNFYLHSILVSYFYLIFSFRTLTRQDLVEYVNSHFKAPRMVLAAAGGRSHELQNCEVFVCLFFLTFRKHYSI